MNTATSIGAGFAGAGIITIIHESVRQVEPDAPRMDLLGMNALSKLLHSMHKSPPDDNKLYWLTMAGDLISNTLYYSAIGLGDKKNVWLKGASLGLAAGIGGVVLPKPLGLNQSHSARTTKTKMMTIGLYLIGGLITAATVKLLEGRMKRKGETAIYEI